MAIDAGGNVLVSGHAQGANQSQFSDVFVGKYDTSGSLLWTQLFGTAESDLGYSVAVDHDGNAFVGGQTYGDLGGPQQGVGDAFVGKCDTSGTLLWTRQLATTSADYGMGVAVDTTGNAFLTGFTYGALDGLNQGLGDAFLSKYSESGTPLWTRQLGSGAHEQCYAAATNASGDVYITGYTEGHLAGPNNGGRDAFVVKYSASGTQLWTKQLGTGASDESNAVAVDAAGNVYICGQTQGSLGGPKNGSTYDWDAFLSKFDSLGTLLWTKQLGTSLGDYGNSVAVDHLGNILISGYTAGALGASNYGSVDAFLSKFDSSGTLLWSQQFGSTDSDCAWSVGTDTLGNAFAAGQTFGNLGDVNQGGLDAFLVKLSPVPEPGGLVMLAGLALTGLVYWWRKRA